MIEALLTLAVTISAVALFVLAIPLDTDPEWLCRLRWWSK